MRFNLLFSVFTLSALLLWSACTPDGPEPESETQPQTTTPAPPPQPAEPDTAAEQPQEIREATAEERTRAESEAQARQTSGSVANLMDSSGSFTVQVAAHRNEYMAERSASQWNERGYSQTHVIRSSDDGETWYKVYLGRYASASNAERASKQLNSEYSESTWPLRFPG